MYDTQIFGPFSGVNEIRSQIVPFYHCHLHWAALILWQSLRINSESISNCFKIHNIFRDTKYHFHWTVWYCTYFAEWKSRCCRCYHPEFMYSTLGYQPLFVHQHLPWPVFADTLTSWLFHWKRQCCAWKNYCVYCSQINHVTNAKISFDRNQ